MVLISSIKKSGKNAPISTLTTTLANWTKKKTTQVVPSRIQVTNPLPRKIYKEIWLLKIKMCRAEPKKMKKSLVKRSNIFITILWTTRQKWSKKISILKLTKKTTIMKTITHIIWSIKKWARRKITPTNHKVVGAVRFQVCKLQFKNNNRLVHNKMEILQIWFRNKKLL